MPASSAPTKHAVDGAAAARVEEERARRVAADGGVQHRRVAAARISSAEPLEIRRLRLDQHAVPAEAALERVRVRLVEAVQRAHLDEDAARAAGRLEQQRKEVHVLAVLRPRAALDALHALAQ